MNQKPQKYYPPEERIATSLEDLSNSLDDIVEELDAIRNILICMYTGSPLPNA